MGRKPNNYNRILEILRDLHIQYPDLNMGRHIATISEDCGDIWGTTDKNLLAIFERYKATLELDTPYTEDKDIEKILKDGMDLDSILEDSEEQGDIY